MATIYLVTSGEYDDYSVNHVCTSREVAQAWVDALNKVHPYDDHRVEESETTEELPVVYEYWTGSASWHELTGFSAPDIRREYSLRPPHEDQVNDRKVKGNKYIEGAAKDENGSWLYYRAVGVFVTAETEHDADIKVHDVLNKAVWNNGKAPE